MYSGVNPWCFQAAFPSTLSRWDLILWDVTAKTADFPLDGDTTSAFPLAVKSSPDPEGMISKNPRE